MNSFYNHSTYPTPNAPGSSANMRAELDLITAGFNKLPTLSGNGYKVAMINAAGTALIASSALQQLALTQSTIDSTPIGGTTRAAGAFTTLSANSTVNLGSAVTIAGGVIDGTIIGGTTPAAGYFTTIEAGTMDVDSLIAGSFEGPLTGNVTGNVTGNLTGNVTAGSGTSSFNNVTINGTLDMNAGTTGTITGLATPTNSSDAAPKGYVDTQRDTRLALAGGTMSGAIAMGTNRITGLGDPSSTQDAATKNYTDTQDALKLSLTGGTMSGAIAMGTNRITGVGDPVGNQDAATKAYVDSVAQGLDVKASVRAATTDNITLSGTATIDSVALSVGDRVLVKNQTTASQNGIYVVSAGGWGRAPDMDAWAELPGAFVFVEDGSVNDNSGWVCTVAPGGTIGTTAVTFEQFSGAGQITAGAGMTKSGNTLNVGTASTARIVVNADNIDLALSGVTGGTYRSVTVDGYGRVTGGTNPTTLAGYGITDAYTTTQVDTALALKLNLSGGTMSGNIAMGNNRITGLPTPSASGEAATKGYADDGLALKLNLTGGTMSGAIAMGGSKITGLGEPTLNQDAVTLNYVTTLYGSTASAAASASAAATSATNAATSATNASNSATAAASSATAAAASFDSFDDRYLGPKSSDPTVDNDGNALLTGALYWNTSLNQMKAYSGSAWLLSYVPSDFYLPLSGGTLTGPTVFNVNSSSDALRITQLGSGNALYIEDVAADATPFVVSSTGVMGIGTTTPDNITSAGIALVSNNGFFPQVVQRNKSNDTTASYLVFDKDRAGSIVQNGDALGAIVWRSFDGANYLQSAAIIGYSDGVPGTNDVPGTLAFFTTADGASSPIERLRISSTGFGTATQDWSFQGVRVGRGAGAVSTNTAVGASALAANTGGQNSTAFGFNAAAASDANNITAVGSRALLTNIGGASLVAVGGDSLRLNTTGSHNTGIGQGALYNNTTGAFNTSVGSSSLQSNTTASNNTVVGYQAAFSNTTGGPITAVGLLAAFAGVTAVNVTAIGAYSLQNSTGGFNTAVGHASLNGNTSGVGNTAMGSDALRNNTTGSNNTALGLQALQASTTASNNTAVGYQAAYANTTGTSLVAIGYRALYGSTASNNVVAIGDGALGSASACFASTVIGSGAGRSVTTGDRNTLIGQGAGGAITTGQSNTIVGPRTTGGTEPGGDITTGSKNTLLGAYSGNQGGLDIRTSNNNIVLSDGDGNPRLIGNGSGHFGLKTVPNGNWPSSWSVLEWQGSNNIWAVQGQVQLGYNNYYDGSNYRYGASGYAHRYAMTDSGHFWESAPSGSANAAISFESQMAIDLQKTLALRGATPQSGTGITFPASQFAASDANTLDDYEEGTWTPSSDSSSNLSSITFSEARYVKIGRVVNVWVRGSATITSSGAKAWMTMTTPFAQGSGSWPQSGNAFFEGPSGSGFPYATGSVVDASSSDSRAFCAWAASAITFTGASSFTIGFTYEAS